MLSTASDKWQHEMNRAVSMVAIDHDSNVGIFPCLLMKGIISMTLESVVATTDNFNTIAQARLKVFHCHRIENMVWFLPLSVASNDHHTLLVKNISQHCFPTDSRFMILFSHCHQLYSMSLGTVCTHSLSQTHRHTELPLLLYPSDATWRASDGVIV